METKISSGFSRPYDAILEQGTVGLGCRLPFKSKFSVCLLHFHFDFLETERGTFGFRQHTVSHSNFSLLLIITHLQMCAHRYYLALFSSSITVMGIYFQSRIHISYT